MLPICSLAFIFWQKMAEAYDAKYDKVNDTNIKIVTDTYLNFNICFADMCAI